MKNIVKNNHAFWVLLAVSIVLLVASFIVPPTGVIDGSVLAAVGELTGLAAIYTVLKALDLGVDAKIKKGDTEIEINND